MEKRFHLNDICVRIEVQQEDTKHESLQSLSVLGATPCFKHKQMNSLDTVPEANRDIETFISLDHRSIADKRPALNKFLLSVKF